MREFRAETLDPLFSKLNNYEARLITSTRGSTHCYRTVQTMAKFYRSLNAKFMARFVIVVVILSILVFLITYGESKTALLGATQETLREVSATMASQIAAEKAIHFKPGDEGSANYTELCDQLRAMRASSTVIINCYVLNLSEGRISFLLDDAESGPAAIGQAYNSSDYPRIVGAWIAPTASSQVYTDQWGSFMSGYAPIKDASNTTVAILGVDMNADAVVANQGFIGGTIYYVMAVGIIIAGTIIYFFSHPLVEDINKLRDASEKLAKGENIAKLDIRRTDEVGELANSFDKISILLAADRGINEESNRKD